MGEPFVLAGADHVTTNWLSEEVTLGDCGAVAGAIATTVATLDHGPVPIAVNAATR
jgi:hypothetical protein